MSPQNRKFKIDCHQHYWKLSRGDYSWLTSDLQPLYRDYLPEDLQPELGRFQIGGTILVQAADTLEETEFLLKLAESHPTILGVVGWIDMAASNASSLLENLAKHPSFLGVRPMIQDIPDVDWMLKGKLTPAFETLIALGLTFDALVLPQHLKNLLTLCRKHPQLKVVVDHAAKPPIRESLIDEWARDIAAVAGNTNAHCKLSGLLTEAPPNSTLATLEPYIDPLFDSFGPQRIMWGSDWPVVNMSNDYASWYQMAEEYVNRKLPEYYRSIFGETAALFYGIPALYRS